MSQPQAQNQASKIGRVHLENVRLMFAQGVFQPKGVVDPATGRTSTPAYSCSFVFPRDHKCVPLIGKAMQEAASAKFGPQAQQTLQALIAGARVCLRDGNSKPDLAGYPGNLFVSARSATPPKFFNHVPLEITLAEAQASGLFYSGVYVSASIAIWAQANQHGKRINAQLLALQSLGRGERVAGGAAPATAEEFGSVEQTAMAANEFGSLFGGNAGAFDGSQRPGVLNQPAQSNDFASLLGVSQ